MKTIVVKSPNFTQRIIIGRNLNETIGVFFKKDKYNKKILIYEDEPMIRDTETYKIFNNTNYIRIKIPASLIKKDLDSVEKILHKVFHFSVNRKSCFIILGGGTLGDLGGFISSVYMRGIDMVYIPTTFMSQCDTIIGKVAINFFDQKNLLGSFFSPKYTFCDFDFLDTLNDYQIASGLVEVWKHSIVKSDYALWDKINAILKNGDLRKACGLIYPSLTIKKHYVTRDFLDLNNIHKALSLGHTTSNYLEKNNKIKHGEGVCNGILFAAFLSSRIKEIKNDKLSKIMGTFKLFSDIMITNREVEKMLKIKPFLKSLESDKINLNDSFSFVIPTTSGYKVEKDVSRDLIKGSLNDLKEFINGN